PGGPPSVQARAHRSAGGRSLRDVLADARPQVGATPHPRARPSSRRRLGRLIQWSRPRPHSSGGNMEPKIVGTVMPVLELSMQPNDKVFAESGQLSWMSMAIQMQTATSAGGQQGGFMGALGRAMAGGTLFMTEYTAVGGPGLLAFAAKRPGRILPLNVTPGQGYMIHLHGFLCAAIGVQFSIGFQQRLGAGVFGGTGFRMQRLQGQGQAWVELHGEVVTYDLQAGNTLRVHPGHVGMYQDSVQLTVTTVPG